jgi:hypothetical protein
MLNISLTENIELLKLLCRRDNSGTGKASGVVTPHG